MAFRRDQEGSSSTSRCAYQVFLSFRGADTRKTFTGHLYTALMQAGIHTFRDDNEIERGEKIISELERGIQQSRVSIIVFSKNYASSRWCLDELVMILKHKASCRHIVIPVFYDVDPTNVKRQTGSIGEMFAQYENQVETEANHETKNLLMKNIKRWRAALKEAANLSGMELKNQANGDESKFIQNVVNVVQYKLSRKILSVGPCLVGMPSRTSDINLWIQDATTDAGIMVISGMGGIGKTTIAKFVFNNNNGDFDGCSFLSNIRERSKQPVGLIDLQKQLLSDICKRKEEHIYNVDEGVYKIRDVICCKRVLLVLDDVDHLDQLNAIFRMQDRLFPGSKIIITTRNEWVIKTFGVYKACKVRTLSNDESVKLFSFHAFRQSHPIKSYMEHVVKIVDRCGGLPLALQILGSSLVGKKLDVWVGLSKKLETIPDGEIVEKLKISYDSLPDDDVKNIFLHIACFFAGEFKDQTIKILDACNMQAAVGVDLLIDRCLLELDSSTKMMMHPLIKDMGRYIVHKESSEPGERSRLWHSQDCFRVLREKTGTETVKVLAFDMQIGGNDNPVESIICGANAKKRRFVEKYGWINSVKRRASSFLSWHVRGNATRNSNILEIDTDAFARMQQLMFLKLNNVELSGSYKEFPRRLRWLSWHRCHFDCVPNDLSLHSLVCLEMQYSSLKKLWRGSKFLPVLKILNLSHCWRLAESPDFSGLPNLERLILQGCTQLVEVCESIKFSEGLLLLDLKDCKRLTKLPRNVSNLIYLENVTISGCSSLCELPMGLRNLESLKVFHADGIDMYALLPLDKGIQSWAFLPQFVENLSLKNCKLLDDSFPKNFCNLLLLKEFNLSGNLIKSLPDCCRTLSKLEKLRLDDCPELQFVLGLPKTLKYILMGADKGHGNLLNANCLSCYDCPELVEVEGCCKLLPVTDVDRRIKNNLGLLELEPILAELDVFKDIKVKLEYGIFSTFVPGDELPGCFNFVSRDSSPIISFTVPNNPKLQGLTVGFVFAERSDYYVSLLSIFNQTRNLKWNHHFGDHSGICTTDKGVAWLSYSKVGSLLRAGDKVTFSIDVCWPKVKEFGVKVVNNGDDEEEIYDDEFYNKLTTQQQKATRLSLTDQTFIQLSDFHIVGTSYRHKQVNQSSRGN